MKVFQQKVRLSGVARKHFVVAYADLARNGPRLDFLGICYNVSQAGRDGYDLTKALFRSVTGKRDDHWPVKSCDVVNWSVRQKWCAAFSASLETGLIEVDEEMEASLQWPVDPKRQL